MHALKGTDWRRGAAAHRRRIMQVMSAGNMASLQCQ